MTLVFWPVLALAVLGLVAGFVQAHRRLDIERGKVPLYAGVAAGVIGWIYARGPLIHLRLYDDFIVIGGWRRIVLRYDQIDRLEMKPRQGIFLGSLRIFHHQPQAPKRIRVDVGDPERLKRMIEARLARPLSHAPRPD